VAREPIEILKNVAPPHLGGTEKEGDSSLISEYIESTNRKQTDEVNEEVLNAQTTKRLQELEDEMEKIRKERKDKEEEWKKNQEALMKPEQINAANQFVEAPAKKTRGLAGFRKKKQGTKEMGKQTSG
jgi:hypothetical protein